MHCHVSFAGARAGAGAGGVGAEPLIARGALGILDAETVATNNPRRPNLILLVDANDMPRNKQAKIEVSFF